MRITLFTSNDIRHNYLINLLSEICNDLFVVQECGTIFPGTIPGHYPPSKIIEKYFRKVNDAQKELFDTHFINSENKNITLLPIVFGDLNKCSISFLSKFLNSDLYIIFGSSYIKGDLINFLCKNRAINIHMGISPYYRGADCNFWALYDNNPHLVGATIHMLSKGLDNGPMLYHAMSKVNKNPFIYSMSTVKAAFHSITERIKDKSIFNIKPLTQNKEVQIRYSKKIEFNEHIINEYFQKDIKLDKIAFNNELLKDPFFFNNKF
tara:strand:- start:2 stop:796 length:795 start_codon:yes stop_codon:yes gene_type:complete